MDFFLFDRPSRLPANACQSDTSLTAGGIFTLAYHPQGRVKVGQMSQAQLSSVNVCRLGVKQFKDVFCHS